MELREYGAFLRRRWWMIVALPLLVGLISLPSLLRRSPTTYTATASFSVTVAREPKTGDYYTYDGYYSWLTSEYLIDDFARVVQGSEFAKAVSQQLTANGSPFKLDPGAVQGSTQAGRLHRILTVTVSAPSADQASALMQAIETTLDTQGSRFFATLEAQPAKAILIDGPSVAAAGRSLRERLDFPIRLLIGLVAGLGLALLLDYLDDSVRSRREVEQIGLRVLAEIPSEHRRLRWRS